MKKLLRDFRIYKLKTNAVKLAILLAAIGADIGIWFGMSASASVETVKTMLSMQWLFIAVLIVCGFLFVHGVVTQFVVDVNRLRGHLENLPTDDREQLLEEYAAAGDSENGRFFLSKFMLYFGYGGGILRYSIIDRISIFQKGLWIESVSRSVLLRTGKNEDKAALMNKLIERTNELRAQKETEDE
ncbi:MAG: hypothetical protein MSH49_03850 [[Eubacterium] saphenum]|nr:hypothetical protein [[Eubacterium] saphenum]